ncbi:hypothetical protein FCM35_KLT01339 [Carex littledalei]|uniref:LTI65/LTI78 N-terminal domain-containing protein n=1 Tax=Carex littledalei TaxID=544730 RepID=A0A833R5G0_9POAL|nr:hypothetical protein FCM35_KLT01339 [Carex littledalei]
MAQEEDQDQHEWMKAWASPRNPNDGKKHLEDYLDDAGHMCSTPNTPTAKTRFSREPSFDSAQNSQEKPTIMTKVHEKAKKWKQILPYIKKHLHGQAHDNEQRQGHEIDNATTSVDLGDGGNTEERVADYLRAPMYESEIAPKLYRQQSVTQQGSVLNSPPQPAQPQSRRATSPPQLTRCKSYRPRPGVKSGIEEVQVHDMARTKSDPVRLKPVRVGSSECPPTSFSFPTSPEIKELDGSEQVIINNRKLERTKYPSSLSPRFVGSPSSLSPRLVVNTYNEPQYSETRLSNTSNSRMICGNNSNDITFTDYNIIVEEINEILDSPSSLSSKAQDHHQDSTKMYQAVSFSGSPELNSHNKPETSRHVSANMWNDGKDTEANPNESPTYKVLSEVAHKIADSKVATNQEPELNATGDRLTVSFAPTETKPRISMTGIQIPTDAPDHSKFEDSRTTTFDNSKIAGSTQILGMDFKGSSSNQVNNTAASQLTSEKLSQNTAEPQPLELNSTSLEIGKPINLKPISTKLTVNHPKGSNSNPVNQDDYKTVTEAVTEILTPAYHAVSEAASKIVESARIGTKKVAKNVPDDNSNSNTVVSDGGDYKTVTEAVGEMLTPVYSAVSHATNRVAGTGYQKGISLRDYLKSKAVVGNTRTRDYSLVGNEKVPGSPVPVSRNPYTEEKEEADGNGRRLQIN